MYIAHGGWAHRQQFSTTFLTRNNSQFVPVLLTSNLSNLGSLDLQSDDLLIEPPRHPLMSTPIQPRRPAGSYRVPHVSPTRISPTLCCPKLAPSFPSSCQQGRFAYALVFVSPTHSHWFRQQASSCSLGVKNQLAIYLHFLIVIETFFLLLKQNQAMHFARIVQLNILRI